MIDNRTRVDRVGNENYNKQGCLMKLIKYENNKNVVVEFQDEYNARVDSSYANFKNGLIRNPYYKSIYNIGYLGEGPYLSTQNKKHTIQYTRWLDMLERCYSKDFHKKCSTYIDCETYEEWHNFQNFAKWNNENYYEIDGEKMCLDKDILIKGNKIYGPETCIFVPEKINLLFGKQQRQRGEYPIGVCFDKKNNNYRSKITKYGNNKSIGSFISQEEAFYAYKIEKEKHIKQVADEYKDKIPQELYDAMYMYEVEIDD